MSSQTAAYHSMGKGAANPNNFEIACALHGRPIILLPTPILKSCLRQCILIKCSVGVRLCVRLFCLSLHLPLNIMIPQGEQPINIIIFFLVTDIRKTICLRVAINIKSYITYSNTTTILVVLHVEQLL